MPPCVLPIVAIVALVLLSASLGAIVYGPLPPILYYECEGIECATNCKKYKLPDRICTQGTAWGCIRGESVCIGTNHYLDSGCSVPSHHNTFVCGRCLLDTTTTSVKRYFGFNCGAQVQMFTGCNSDCSACSAATTLPYLTCVNVLPLGITVGRMTAPFMCNTTQMDRYNSNSSCVASNIRQIEYPPQLVCEANFIANTSFYYQCQEDSPTASPSFSLTTTLSNSVREQVAVETVTPTLTLKRSRHSRTLTLLATPPATSAPPVSTTVAPSTTTAAPPTTESPPTTTVAPAGSTDSPAETPTTDTVVNDTTVVPQPSTSIGTIEPSASPLPSATPLPSTIQPTTQTPQPTSSPTQAPPPPSPPPPPETHTLTLATVMPLVTFTPPHQLLHSASTTASRPLPTSSGAPPPPGLEATRTDSISTSRLVPHSTSSSSEQPPQRPTATAMLPQRYSPTVTAQAQPPASPTTGPLTTAPASTPATTNSIVTPTAAPVVPTPTPNNTATGLPANAAAEGDLDDTATGRTVGIALGVILLLLLLCCALLAAFVFRRRRQRLAGGGVELDFKSELLYAFSDPAKYNRRFDVVGAADQEELLSLPPDADVIMGSDDKPKGQGYAPPFVGPPMSADLL